MMNQEQTEKVINLLELILNELRGKNEQHIQGETMSIAEWDAWYEHSELDCG